MRIAYLGPEVNAGCRPSSREFSPMHRKGCRSRARPQHWLRSATAVRLCACRSRTRSTVPCCLLFDSRQLAWCSLRQAGRDVQHRGQTRAQFFATCGPWRPFRRRLHRCGGGWRPIFPSPTCGRFIPTRTPAVDGLVDAADLRRRRPLGWGLRPGRRCRWTNPPAPSPSSLVGRPGPPPRAPERSHVCSAAASTTSPVLVAALADGIRGIDFTRIEPGPPSRTWHLSVLRGCRFTSTTRLPPRHSSAAVHRR